MGKIKQLAGQTAVYGLSSIIGRLLNYLLVPLYTNIFSTGEYGVVTELYAYLSFLIIVLTYGMETGFFRFWESEKGNLKVYSTSLISLFVSSFVFIVLVIVFSKPIASVLEYNNHSEYVIWLGIIIGFDALTAIPFAYLRQQNKALKFALIKLINIIIFIGLNLFFLLLCPLLIKNGIKIPNWIYSSEVGVGYIFISNMFASVITLILLIPTMKIKFSFDAVIWKKMLLYSLPLLIAGLAGMVNETFDRAMLKRLLTDTSTAMEQLGIYGANYKVSILMTLFIQTFRYAAEPFFFSQAKEKNAKELYAQVMKYFIIFGLIIFLGVLLYLDIIKYFIGENFRSGLKVVPILLLANLFLGIFFNLSIWYKLTNKTSWGALLAIFGAVITISFNLWLIPIMGYMGAAWATLICYFAMMVASFLLGNMFYKVKYPLLRIGIYFLAAFAIYAVSLIVKIDSSSLSLLFNSFLFVLYIVFVLYMEPSLKQKLK
ncbi:MAG: polysaccharide biosynthesis protein [Bacteroidetes bacterium CG02_land_8_20_14_3_00_31_25]|nr:MAG: polysaccharide biosynthesis protein [Bacteroidetes bacterium CG02_land_8_20_14_3_00_31_25]PIX36210.1 MAG: polysaccharide biosynthesis protein [Bacteroidetes bacterium CG_4_8_14_3_um_filter_31_14]